MKTIWWIRRDLRLGDNLTLQAASREAQVLPVFILDPRLLTGTPARRQAFLFNGLQTLAADLQMRGSNLVIRRGDPAKILAELIADSGAQTVFAEEDFTPYAVQRDKAIAEQLPLTLIQRQLVHHPMAVLKSNGQPYTIYTPFSKTWKSIMPGSLHPTPAPDTISTIPGITSDPIPARSTEQLFPAGEAEANKRLTSFLDERIYDYGENRNRLDIDGTSALSPYLHFGMLGLRSAVDYARQAISVSHNEESRKSSQTWLNELIWREFYIHILYHFPHVQKNSFRTQYDQIQWRNDPDEFEAWKQGQTGYPVVDAAMRQMLATGWMHNRARMIVASFLVKDLLIDWRWGERWFMQNLLDGDVAANNGGWQWTAGTGTDAAPYFRIFNPLLQSKKFDPQGVYIKKWVPELAHLDANIIHAPWEKNITLANYPEPVVDHKFARQRTLEAYKNARS